MMAEFGNLAANPTGLLESKTQLHLHAPGTGTAVLASKTCDSLPDPKGAAIGRARQNDLCFQGGCLLEALTRLGSAV